MKGILNRFGDKDQAVILIESIKKELVVPTHTLPSGSTVNTVFNMKQVDGEFEIISIDEQTTQDEAQKSADLMNKLRAKKKGSKFKRR